MPECVCCVDVESGERRLVGAVAQVVVCFSVFDVGEFVNRDFVEGRSRKE